MGSYSYKDVIYRDDYTKQKKIWEERWGEESDDDPNYDGDCWSIVSDLLDAKNARIEELEEALVRYANEDSIAGGYGCGCFPDPEDFVLEFMTKEQIESAQQRLSEKGE